MYRVVVTGMGAVTPVGMDANRLWDSIKNGRHNFAPIKSFDASDFEVKLASEIDSWDPVKYGINKKESKRMDRYTQFAVVAANEAVKMSNMEVRDPYKVGVIVGSGIGGIQTITSEYDKFLAKGANRISVFFIPMMIVNIAAGLIAMEHDFRGANYSPVSACATGTHAIGEAFRLIKHGYLSAVLAGGAEAAIGELEMAGFNNMGALTRSTDPDRASIPFDKERSGFVMGEGAGMLMLEEYEHAKARGAVMYAEIVGYGATADAYHITSPRPDGDGAAKAMSLAIEEAGITPEDIDYINAHGTSTPLNDVYETVAIKKALGDSAKKVMVSSTKSVTGHLLGAAGAVEAIIIAKALGEGIVPPTINYKVLDEACDLDYVTDGAREKEIEYALSNSLGFGGHNATIAMRRIKN